MTGSEGFITIDFPTAVQVVLLGFVGGVMSGFVGTGGAFFMTPGMMNLGVPGVIAVGSNIAHKFGKALMGAKKHSEMGHVDKKLGLLMLITALIGVRLAVWLNQKILDLGSGTHGEGMNSAAGDLYISGIFVCVLSIVAVAVLSDAVIAGGRGKGPSTRLAEAFSKVKIPPLVVLETADVKLSFWVIALVGFVTGYLAGTIGAGGFVGIPAMIYIFGVPAAVAAGTELYLAIFMGAWGAINYAWGGFVDLRLALLLYLGSLSGIYIGAYGTKVLTEKIIRMATGGIILLSVLSRALNIPVYLHELDWVRLGSGTVSGFALTSKLVLFASGIAGVAFILAAVFRAYARRRRVQELLDRIGT
ncbi:MAG: sulfite exporter TauE/SafE family protein [bacterium]